MTSQATAHTTVHNPKIAARKITLAELKDLPTLKAQTDRHNPIVHYDLVTTLRDRIDAVLGAKIAKYDLAVGRGKDFYIVKGQHGADTAAIYGTLILEKEGPAGTSYAIGFRGANDRTMSLRMIGGMNVHVCDNGLFYGEEEFLQEKHLTSLDLGAKLDESLKNLKPRFAEMSEGVRKLKSDKIADEIAKAVIFDALLGHILPDHLKGKVWKEWREPRHEEFRPRTMWSLYNGFTEVMKELPVTTRTTKIQQLGVLVGFGEAKSEKEEAKN